MLQRQFRLTPALLCSLNAFIFAPTSCALDPGREISQAHLDYWGQKQGFPGGSVNAIAQTLDGYLWIGAQNGLVRFDGQRFTLFSRQSAPSFPEEPVLGLRSDLTGGLWIRLHSPGLFRFHDGSFQPMLPGASDIAGVTALGTGVRGDVLLARFGDPLRFDGGLMSHLLQSGGPNQLTISIEETSDKVLWIGTRDSGLLGYRDGTLFSLDRLPDRKVNCLLRGRKGSLWIGTDSGLTLWTGSELRRPKMPPSLSHIQVLSLASDRDGNVWIGTAKGLARLTDHGEVSEESFAAVQTSPVNSLFEDREGNLWVGRSNGIERYRDAVFQSYPTGVGHESDNYGPLCTDAGGRLWFGPSTGGLSWLRSTEKHTLFQAGLPNDVVYSIECGPGGLWVGRQKGGLTHLVEGRQRFKAENFTTRNGLAKGPVYVVYRSRDGSVWAGTANGGVSRLEKGRITTYTTRNGLASNAITAIQQTRDGTMWVATLDGLMSFANGIWQVHSGDSGLPPARINCLFVDANDVLWIGTEAGLAFSKDGRTVTSPRLPEILQGNIFGIVDDGLGYLWLTADHYLLRASRAALMAADVQAEQLRQFDIPDGLPGIDGVRRHHSVVKDGTSRIWFSLQGGIAVVNPARIPSRSPPALLHVEEVDVNGRSISTRMFLRLKPNQQRVEFRYIGLSFSAPENVQYRYRLDGFDHEWAAASPSTRAVYTNLSPGTYCFRVISSNSEGIWNSAEAKFSFQIDPYIWQTFWFRSAALLLASAGLVGIYRFRLHQLTTQLNARFEERLAERTRIARELHDTLLQSLHMARKRGSIKRRNSVVGNNARAKK
jgi:ligand-binding sensor domain-containing protein